jgi:hypothetical protein
LRAPPVTTGKQIPLKRGKPGLAQAESGFFASAR